MRLVVKARLFTAILCIMAFVICATASSTGREPERVDCDIHTGPCSASLEDLRVTLEVNPKPVRAMEDLTFTVRVAGEKFVGDPYIDLGMPSMNMGRNRVSLKKTGKSVYEGKGVIVRCPSGRRTWKARVTVPHAGSVEFVFDVVY